MQWQAESQLPKDIHVLMYRAGDYNMLYGKGELKLWIELKLLIS